MSESVFRSRIAVVGAGPVGLMHAIELFRRGVACRVFDRANAHAETSRACVVHTRTLEHVAQAGIDEPFVTQGRRVRAMNYHFYDDAGAVAEAARLDFTGLDSRYPYVLTIPQSVIEQILREHLASLGGEIEWNTELRSLTTDAGGAVTMRVVDTTTGRDETLHPQWVIGCDGLNSTVRRHLGLAFVGGEYHAGEMRMTDAVLTATSSGLALPGEDLDYHIHEHRMALLIPLPGRTHRVLVSDMNPVSGAGISRAGFQSALDDYFHGALTLGDLEGTANFYIRNRVSNRFRRGNIFLAGDAAHIHSPAGGQGMNLGMQDAVNLGWRLALVARGEAPPAILEDYERERVPVAHQVIARTKQLHDLLMAHGTPLAERLAILRDPGFIHQAVLGISGIATTYRAPDPNTPAITSRGGLAVGDRAPDTALTPRCRVHDVLRHPGHTVLAFQRHAQSTPALRALHDYVGQRFGARVRVSVITAPDLRGLAPNGAVIADSDAAHNLYGAYDTDALCLLRPDGHIDHLCELPQQHTLLTTLGADLT
ncbi:FAD-dependent monooxygenase [Nocardia beijingensis]|uniref:FAD-dependent monooxygenase n=1 Tax=Nocardia beijingensis TaxID=95162 RepID=UPI000A07C9FB|nr:FAD-dependent monooxygenase [Nocardia beijingensis]